MDNNLPGSPAWQSKMIIGIYCCWKNNWIIGDWIDVIGFLWKDQARNERIVEMDLSLSVIGDGWMGDPL